ncbi:hypothetical protein BAR24_12930 [Gluconobacter oxydans]|nr:hypothetical protein B932_2629 [Gluconobacter oxydans H24]ANQ42282.1 hypothetical protein BAR24_12930 [Gluconobacter oxydans]
MGPNFSIKTKMVRGSQVVSDGLRTHETLLDGGYKERHHDTLWIIRADIVLGRLQSCGRGAAAGAAGGSAVR